MIRKVILTIMAFVFVFSTIGVGLALDKGNKRKGKYTYRKVYKACFERGEAESKTPSISPADRTQAEWTSLFESQNFSQLGCRDDWAKLSEKEVTDIYTYMYEHAADSPTPAKCK